MLDVVVEFSASKLSFCNSLVYFLTFCIQKEHIVTSPLTKTDL